MGFMVKRVPPRLYPLLDPLTLAFDKMVNGDLSPWGLHPPSEGLLSAMATRHHGLTVDRGFVAAVKDGDIEIVPAVTGFSADQVLLQGREPIMPEVVICATGQRPVLDALVGDLGVLTGDGLPAAHGKKTHAGAPGLHFIGFRLPPGQLPDMSRDAKAIARCIRGSRDRA